MRKSCEERKCKLRCQLCSSWVSRLLRPQSGITRLVSKHMATCLWDRFFIILSSFHSGSAFPPSFNRCLLAQSSVLSFFFHVFWMPGNLYSEQGRDQSHERSCRRIFMSRRLPPPHVTIWLIVTYRGVLARNVGGIFIADFCAPESAVCQSDRLAPPALLSVSI